MIPATEKASAGQLIDDIRTYIQDAQEICERGEFISLQGLDSRVEQICQSIHEMDAEEAKKYAEELDKLSEQLDALQQMFKQKRDSLRDDLDDTTRHQNAAKAYKTAESKSPASQPPESGE